MCGGTTYGRVRLQEVSGLSPRVRGNLLIATARVIRSGSIPACAGEPTIEAMNQNMNRVYPRVCGGTRRRDGHTGRLGGLSPRVRGNLLATRAAFAIPGSIPACAGEPTLRFEGRQGPRVYPRVCGGTRGCRLG